MFGNRNKDFLLQKVLKEISEEEKKHSYLLEEMKDLKNLFEA